MPFVHNIQTMKNYDHLNPELVRLMRQATFVSTDTVDIEHPLNWNQLREQAKREFALEDIYMLDASGLIVDVLKGNI